MKLIAALLAFAVTAVAFAQSAPPRSGSAGNTISDSNFRDDPTPTTRPTWNPNGQPTTPRPTPTTPAPAPRPQPRPVPQPQPQPQPRTDRYEPQTTGRNPNWIYAGDFVLYNGLEYEVMGGNNRDTLEVRTPFSNQRYFIPVAAVAKTWGCVEANYGRICVGSMTIGFNNVYYSVIGMEWNGRVVVQTTDGSRTVFGQIDPNSLRIVRE